ncbi:MAG: hypothetical protein ACREHE_17420 [Rhizomicrobium sp.]
MARAPVAKRRRKDARKKPNPKSKRAAALGDAAFLNASTTALMPVLKSLMQASSANARHYRQAVLENTRAQSTALLTAIAAAGTLLR